MPNLRPRKDGVGGEGGLERERPTPAAAGFGSRPRDRDGPSFASDTLPGLEAHASDVHDLPGRYHGGARVLHDHRTLASPARAPVPGRELGVVRKQARIKETRESEHSSRLTDNPRQLERSPPRLLLLR